MMISRLRIASMLALSAFLSACGSTNDNITFTAPPGWTTTASVLSFMTMYGSPDKKQVLMLMKLPMQTNDLGSAMKQSSAKNTTVNETHAIKICGSQDAMYAVGTSDVQTANEAKDSAQGKDTKRDQDRMEMVMTSVGGATYMAMYMRPQTMAADAAAEGAIKNLCPKH